MKDPVRENLIADIQRLKKEKNAVILAHNYQLGEIQDIADFTGDSLELAVKAAKTDAEVILFAGVLFMAETAFILSPNRTVLLPRLESGCPMADMADADGVRALKAKHPGAVVVTYVNSSAEVKAESDLCVTSANAVKIIRSIPADREIIFVPDRGLGAFCAREADRELILWPGYCPVHMRITSEMILRRKAEFPDAEVIIHPESALDVIDLADAALSTGQMLRRVKESPKKQFIVATESGLIHRLQNENPEKQFIPISEQIICPMMKMHRLEDIVTSLSTLSHRITVPLEIAERARLPIERMLELSK